MASNVWDEVPDWGGIGALRLERAATGLGASVWELQPGSTQLVYHFHHGSDELLIVLRGTPTVRMHDGDHVLREGDVLPFPHGIEGGHQMRNDGGEVARVAIVSSNASPDVAEYPEAGKVAWIVDGEHHFHRVADAVEHGFPDE
ncbi:MAG TPA: cupin domain-containing protein [Gaiellaceae bacterium]|nr:cupin domain-containing protein [Gaiellaceae bacterium]